MTTTMHSAFGRQDFRTVLGHFPSGVSIVASLDDGEPVGFTCQSFFSLSLDPPLIAIAPGKSSTSWPRIERSGRFTVSVLSAEQEETCLAFAVSGGSKFAGCDWVRGPLDTPRILGAVAWIDCVAESIVDAGDHYLVVGRVQDLCGHPGDPLLFFKGGFSALAEAVARSA